MKKVAFRLNQNFRGFKVKNSYSAKSVYSFSIHKKVSNSGLFLPFFEAVKDQNNDENG